MVNTKHLYQFLLLIVFIHGLISGANASSGHSTNVGLRHSANVGPGNGGGGDLCSAKISRARILAKALVKDSSTLKLDGLEIDSEALKIIKNQERAKIIEEISALEFQIEDEPVLAEDVDTLKMKKVDMLTNLTTREVRVYIEKCDQHSDIEVAALIIHEAEHVLTQLRSSTKNEKLLWAVTNGLIQSVDPIINAKLANDSIVGMGAASKLENTKSTGALTQDYVFPKSLKELIVNADPVYSKYLLPGNFPHSETTVAYDMLKTGREALYRQFNEILKSLQMDENGIINLHQSFDSAAEANIYGEAIKAAYGPHTGLKVVGGLTKETDFVYGTGFNDFPSSFTYSSFLVVNPNSEHDIEIIKAENFKKIEEHVHTVREAVTKTLAQDARTLESFNNIYGKDASEEQIMQKILKSKGAMSALSTSLVQMTPEEFRKTIPRDVKGRITYLKSCLDYSNTLLTSAIEKSNKDTVEVLMKWNSFLKEELLK